MVQKKTLNTQQVLGPAEPGYKVLYCFHLWTLDVRHCQLWAPWNPESLSVERMTLFCSSDHYTEEAGPDCGQSP